MSTEFESDGEPNWYWNREGQVATVLRASAD